MPAAPARPPTTKWRFSLGSIMLVMTGVSILCALVRAVPMSDEMRQAMWVLAFLWAILTLIVLAPGWLRYSALRRQFRRQEAELLQWAEQQRAEARNAPAGGSENADQAT